MNIHFTGRNYNLSERVKDFTQDKLAKLNKFIDEPVDIHVILEVEKRRQIAELHITHRHGSLQAKEEAEQMYDAIHAVVEKTEKQARRNHKKHTDKKRRAARHQDLGHHWPMDVLEESSLSVGNAPRIIKSTYLPIKPMTIDEAALQLEGSKNEFFVFLDSSTERVSVLFKRKDNNYGLIAPEF